jgi:DNA-binding transcriptional LysR family regulator
MAAVSSVHSSGRLRKHAARSFGRHVLTSLLSLYSENLPSVAVDLVVGRRLPDRIDGDHDVAIEVTAALSDSSSISLALGSFRHILCASVDLPDTRRHAKLIFESLSFPNLKIIGHQLHVTRSMLRGRPMAAAGFATCRDGCWHAIAFRCIVWHHTL